MIEGVSARSVAISARPVMEDITSRAISSPTGKAIPHDVVIDTSDGSQRASVEQLTGELGSPTHDSVDSVRIAESDSEESRQSDSTPQYRPFKELPNATGPLRAAYDRIRQLEKIAYRHRRKVRDAQHEVRKTRWSGSGVAGAA